MKNTLSATAVALTLAFAAPGHAQETTAPASQASSGMMGGMKMDDMMKQCRTHCQQMSSSMEDLTNTIQQAKASNEPAQMREALNKAETTLSEMKENMSSCRSMMDMMHKMHGGGGMDMMGEKKE